MICRSNLNLSLPADGVSTITPAMLLANPNCNPADFYVEIIDNQGNIIGNEITCEQVGQTVDAGVFHQVTGISCRSMITVNDYFKPQIQCNDTLLSCISDYSVAALGTPTVTDNCGIADLDYIESFTAVDCFTTNSNGDTITAIIERVWTATDVNGNTSSCTQYIYLERNEIDDVVFPAHRDGLSNPALDCQDDPQDLSLTDEPRINNRPILSNGHCELVVTATDQTIEFCGPGGYRILRNWRVVDYCTGEFKEYIQIIKITDTTAPEINCIADIQEFTDTYSCDATITLPTITATDDCSVVEITPEWTYGTGYGPFTGVAIGDHIVTYTAEDACGNTSTCTIVITISDDIIPAMICEREKQVVLTGNGITFFNAPSFDDDSYDNCELDRFEVSRDGSSFAGQVGFDCGDVNQPVLVNLRAYDIYGNFNTCEIIVEVIDGVRPVITCPAQVILDCTDDYENLTLTGIPLVSDACGIDTIYYQDNVMINNCRVGRVVRTWTAIDQNGNVKNCNQQILIEDNSLLEISFPANYQSYECNADLSPEVTGVPVLTNHNCEEVSVASNDFLIPIAEPACLRILREWTVVNWCKYDPNSGSDEGYHTYTQEIILSDTIAPEIMVFADTTLGSFNANCEADYIALPKVTASDCSDTITIQNNSPFAFANGADASGDYPTGIHQIVFTASDGCGNTTTQAVTITVIDALPPTISCIGNISLSIGNQGFIVVDRGDVLLSSEDNCTATADLIFSLSRDTFTCMDLGMTEITLTVEDENGNRNSCNTIVELQNNMGVCVPTVATIGGQILKENGAMVEGFWVYLSGDLIDSVQTNEMGFYEFSDLEIGGNYQVRPSHNNKIVNGVSTFDLIKLGQHLLGTDEVDSPYRYLAADVNNSRSITSVDMIGMRRAILLIDTLFARTESWKFVDAGFDFTNESNYLRADYNEYFVVNDLQEPLDSLDFVAIKVGDLNDNGVPTALHSEVGDTRADTEEASIILSNQKLIKGKNYEISVTMENLETVRGMQFAFEATEAIAFLEVIVGEEAKEMNWSLDNFGTQRLEEGILLVSWTKEQGKITPSTAPLFTIKIKALRTGRLENTLNLSEQWLSGEAYIQETDRKITAVPLHISFTTPAVLSEETRTLQFFPNPVVHQASISLPIDIEGAASWEIYDELGRMMSQGSQQSVNESNQLMLTRSELGGGTGLRFFRLVYLSDGKTWNGSFILSD